LRGDDLTPVSTHSYTLDSEGNRTQLVEFVSGITPAGTTETFTLGYDGLGERLTWQYAAGFVLAVAEISLVATSQAS